MASKLTDEIDGPSGRDLQPGESRMVNVREWRDGKLGDVAGTIIVRRTSRPYVYDLADAYNENLSSTSEAAGLAWQVTQRGDLIFTTTPQREAENHKRAMRIMRSIDDAAHSRAA